MTSETRVGEVAVGQYWRDKDPRSPNRVKVLSITLRRDQTYYVYIQRPSRKVRVRIDRFIRRFSREDG